MSVLFSLLGVIAFVSLFDNSSANGDVLLNSIKVVQGKYGPDYYDYGKRTNEFAFISFDVDADLRPLFNWNTKQVFAYVVAEYTSKSHNRNQVSIWDKIITSKKDAQLHLINVRNKYALIDVGTKWKGLSANLTLHWDITPHVGLLRSGQTTKAMHFDFPPVDSHHR